MQIQEFVPPAPATARDAKTGVRPAASGPAPAHTEVDPAEVASSVAAANAAMQALANGIEFSVDKTTGKTVVRVVDRNTNELIRQIPSPEMVAIAQALDKLQGLLIKQRI